MESNSDDGAMICGSQEAGCSDSTIEIKIKTLDSQIYTLRVDKDVQVLALKEQIVPVTGVPSQEQRLLFRGNVLNNDQRLSAYNVKDGQLIHLVVGQPIPPSSESLLPIATSSESLPPFASSSESLLNNTATCPASGAGNSQSRQASLYTVTFGIRTAHAETINLSRLNQAPGNLTGSRYNSGHRPELNVAASIHFPSVEFDMILVLVPLQQPGSDSEAGSSRIEDVPDRPSPPSS